MFEDPKVTNEEGRKVESSFKKEFGMGRPTEERIRVFKEFEKQAEQNPGAGLYNQYVQWGNELIDKTAGFNTREANAILNAFKKATGQQGNEIKKQIKDNEYLSTTAKFDSNILFELGRRYSPYGRLFSHAIINDNNLLFDENQRKVKGWAFIPQEGNTILSTIHAFLLQVGASDTSDVMKAIKKDLIKSAW